MPTLYHAPQSRSDSIVTLIHLMGIHDKVDVVEVTIPVRMVPAASIPGTPTPRARCPI